MLLGHHVLGKGLGGQQGALEVQLEHEVHAAGLQIEEGLAALLGLVLVLVVGGGPGIVAAGAVHQNVAGAQVGQHRLMHGLQRLGVQNIGLVALADEAFGLQLLRQLLHRILVQVQSRHLGAALGKGPGHDAAQHAARTGHNHNLAAIINIQRKICHFLLPPIKSFRPNGPAYPTRPACT